MEVSTYIIKSIAFKISTLLNEGKIQKKVSAQSDVIDMGYALFQSNIMSFGDEKYNSNISLTTSGMIEFHELNIFPSQTHTPNTSKCEIVWISERKKKKKRKPHNSKNIWIFDQRLGFCFVFLDLIGEEFGFSVLV